MGGLVDMVVVFGLKKEMTDLTRSHRHQPRNQRGDYRVDKQKYISHQKRHSADQMQKLVDAAMVVIAVVVPTLGGDGLEKGMHSGS